MSKHGNNLSKSRFGCYFRRSLVNFKNLIILFWNIWVIYDSRKSWGSAVFWFGIYQKRFVIRDLESLNSISVPLSICNLFTHFDYFFLIFVCHIQHPHRVVFGTRLPTWSNLTSLGNWRPFVILSNWFISWFDQHNGNVTSKISMRYVFKCVYLLVSTTWRCNGRV